MCCGRYEISQIFENQKTKNENNNLYNLTSVHHQLRKQNKTKQQLLSLSTKTVMTLNNVGLARTA